jgi:hypothetical protein
VVGAGELLFEMEQKQLRVVEKAKKGTLKVLISTFNPEAPDAHIGCLIGMTTKVMLKIQDKTIDEAYDIYLKSLFETAMSMLNEGKSIAEIIESTELSYRAIETIKYNLGDEIEGEYFVTLIENAW